MQIFWYVVRLPLFCLMNKEEGNVLCPVILKKGCQTHSYFLYMLSYLWFKQRDRLLDEESR